MSQVCCITFIHLFNSCSANLCALSNPNTTWTSCSTSVLIQNVCGNYSLFARLPLANSSFGWIVGPCGVVFAVYSTDCQHTSSRIANIMHFSPSRRLTQRVFIAPVGVNKKNSSVRSSLPTKLLASTSCSIWLHQHMFRSNSCLVFH